MIKLNKIDFTGRWTHPVSFGVVFVSLYWILESIRDVLLFEKGNIVERVFFPDMMSFWMRFLVVCLIILFSILVQSMKKNEETPEEEHPGFVHNYGVIGCGSGVAALYWILESVRDVFVFGKGNIFDRILTPDPMSLWMRLLAVGILLLFSIYAQSIIQTRKRAEKILREEQENLEKKVEERTVELVKSNELLKRAIDKRDCVVQELNVVNKQLMQAQKMEEVGILTGGIAHDFNNLLTAVLGCVDLALMNIEEDNILYEDLKEIHKLARNGADTVRQLLIFSRKHPMEFVIVDLNRIIDAMSKMFRRLIGEDIKFITDLESDLWCIRADRGMIEQVVMNLVINARDAMPDGGWLKIRTESRMVNQEENRSVSRARAGRYVCLSVSDTGQGMDEQLIHRIFEPFFTTKEACNGTGLGLSVTNGIIRKHEGWIHVTSRYGRGSVFEIFLPAVSAFVEEEAKDFVSTEGQQGGGKRVLMVEDEVKILEYISEGLTKCGYQVSKATSAREAVALYESKQGDFCAVCSDVVLPDRNGLELADELHLRNPSIGIVLSSGYTDHKSRWPMIQEKGFRFLPKPYTLNHLLRVLREEDKSRPA